MPNQQTQLIRTGPELNALIKRENVQTLVGKLLPDNVTQTGLDRLLSQMYLAIRQNPKILQNGCTPESVAQCVSTLAAYHLSPLPQQAEAYLIPYGKDLTCSIGYLGMRKMILRDNKTIRDVYAQVVRAKDVFRYKLAPTMEITEHSINPNADRGDLTHVYSIALFRDGYTSVEVMDKAEIEKVRACSKMGNAGAWKTWYEQMARKAVMRRHCKFIPMTDEVREVILSDHDLQTEPIQVQSEVLSSGQSSTGALTARLTGKQGQEPVEQREPLVVAPDIVPDPPVEEFPTDMTEEEKADILAQEKKEGFGGIVEEAKGMFDDQ